jgi:hypothetical protein
LRAFITIAVLAAAVAVVCAAPAQATTVIRGKTFTDFQIHAGAHDVVYEDCTFVGGHPQISVVRIDRACRNITFRDCEIQSGPWNGVSVNDRHGNIHDIVFERCTFRAQARMGFECTTRPVDSGKGYRGIKLIRCVFEPQGSEAISFDGNSACVGNGVFGSVIRGAGTNPDFPWGQGVEVNRVGKFRFVNNKVYQCRGALLNLQRESRANCRWTFTGNRLDATVHKQAVPMDPLAQVVCAVGVWGGEFHNNVIRSSHPGAGVAWFGDCHRMDWRRNKWQDARRGAWDEPLQQWGCSGNLF